MANISGTGGSFTAISGFSANFSGWAATINVTNVETTGFADNGNRVFDPTAQVVTGAAVGTAITGGSIPAGVTGATPAFGSYKGTVLLTLLSGSTMGFSASVTAISLNRPNDGKADFTFAFTSSGPLTGAL